MEYSTDINVIIADIYKGQKWSNLYGDFHNNKGLLVHRIGERTGCGIFWVAENISTATNTSAATDTDIKLLKLQTNNSKEQLRELVNNALSQNLKYLLCFNSNGQAQYKTSAAMFFD